MSMGVKDAVKRVSEIRQKWEKEFDKHEGEMGKVVAKSGYAHWATWNLPSMLYAERMIMEWKKIEAGAKSHKDEKIVVNFSDWLKEVREMYIGWIMNSTLNRSTSTVSNVITDIEHDIYKKIAGHNIFDSDSLIAIIVEMERE